MQGANKQDPGVITGFRGDVQGAAWRRASYCEIYNEGLHDLIRYNNRAQLAVRWDPGHGFHVPELAKVAAPTLQDMYKVWAHPAACCSHCTLRACTQALCMQ